ICRRQKPNPIVIQSTAPNFKEFPTRSSFLDSVNAQIVVSLSVRFCFGESFYFLPGHSRPSRLPACTQFNRPPLQTIHFSVREIGNKWLLNLSLVFFPAIWQSTWVPPTRWFMRRAGASSSLSLQSSQSIRLP